jgi:hypothetical protein
MHSLDVNEFNWLSKYCPNPNHASSCADDDTLWKRYLLSVCVARPRYLAVRI